MTETNAFPRSRARQIGLGLVFLGAAVIGAGWYWRAAPQPARETQSAPAMMAARPVNYPTTGGEPSPRTEFPTGAAMMSGPEITAALSDHTALLPGGFIEYYAPNGALHGLAEEKRYGGSWEVRDGDFCTLLEGSDAKICSPVERQGTTLYWSMDGEKQADPVATLPGNPRNLR
jgi:hypothetical protein